MIDSLEQWWDEDRHGKTKTPEQECVSALYNINSIININIKIIFLDTWKYVSFHWWSCLDLYANFYCIRGMHFALFLIVQLCIQFQVRESVDAGLLYCQSLILDVPVSDGFFHLSSVISHVWKNQSLLPFVDCCTPITMVYASSYLCASYPTSCVIC